ncbi:unnamed protein product, partial [Leuciscus chuanchicus]
MENESFRNMPVKSALTVLEKEVCDKAKKLNALKQTTDTQRQRLEELKRQYESMKPLPDNQELDEEKKLRILENRLEEAQLKRHEAKNVMRGYLKEKDKLQGDSFTFQPRLDRMEAEIHRQTQVLKELQVTNGDAHFSKDAAMRRKREKILSLYKKQQEERIAQAKERKRRLPDELSSEANAVEEVEAISPFEEAFQQIREATGVTDPRDQMFERRPRSQNYNKLKKSFTEDSLQFHQQKFSFKTHTVALTKKWSRKLLASMTLCFNTLKKDLSQTQNKSIFHFWNIPLGLWQMKGPTPQLTPDSEEQTLQLMSEAEQKLMLLKEELQGKDLATILKEIEEEEAAQTHEPIP